MEEEIEAAIAERITRLRERHHAIKPAAPPYTFIPQRQWYMVGSIWWVRRQGWFGCGGFYTNESRLHHPGLVLRESRTPTEKLVIMAPGTSREMTAHAAQQRMFFCPQNVTTGETNPKRQTFVMKYRQPVHKSYVADRLTSLSEQDRNRLIADYDLSVHDPVTPEALP